MYVCLGLSCVMHMCTCAHGGQKRPSFPVELELPWSSKKSSLQNSLSYSPCPSFSFCAIQAHHSWKATHNEGLPLTNSKHVQAYEFTLDYVGVKFKSICTGVIHDLSENGPPTYFLWWQWIYTSPWAWPGARSQLLWYRRHTAESRSSCDPHL